MSGDLNRSDREGGGDQSSSASESLIVRVYRSLEQVLSILTSSENINFPETQQLLQVATERQLIHKTENGNYIPATATVFPSSASASSLLRAETSPFIVIEGMDGSGKTTLTELLREKFNLLRLETPPKYIRDINGMNVRDFFDKQNETLKRAYYGIGNYLASKDVLEAERPVVMDRFWHSTTAYAFANFLKTGSGESCYANEDLSWPTDLVQPNLVIFLTVSEQERIRRHSTRPDFTNTEEEKTLAIDPKFRENLKNCYKKISGVQFEEFDCDGAQEQTCANMIKFVSSKFPALQVESLKGLII